MSSPANDKFIGYINSDYGSYERLLLGSEEVIKRKLNDLFHVLYGNKVRVNHLELLGFICNFYSSLLDFDTIISDFSEKVFAPYENLRCEEKKN